MNKKNYRTVRTKVYQFDALSDKAKKKAIEQCRYFNVDGEWWEFIYDDFKRICETVGVDVDLKKTHFRFSSQGDGAAFTADVDLFKLIDGINGEAWRQEAPNLDKENNFTPPHCSVDRRVLDLIKRDWISFTVNLEAKDRPYHTKADIEYDYTQDSCGSYENIENQLDLLYLWVKDVVIELNHLLYRILKREYEWRTSDEAVIETIKANEYEFLADGKRF